MSEPRDTATDPQQLLALQRRLAQLEQQNAALRAEQRRFARALGNAGVGAWEWDVPGGTVWWSPACYDLLGYRPEEFTPTPDSLDLVVPGGDARASLAHLQGAPGSEQTIAEDQDLRQRDGRILPTRVECRVVFGPDGRPRLLSGVIQDRSSLARVQARYRRLFDTAADFVFVHPDAPDLAGVRFEEVNDAVCRRLGYSREELCRRGPADILAPGEDPALSPQERPGDHRQECLFTRTLVDRHGGRIPAEFRARLFVEDGRPMVVTVARDISARQRVRDSLDALIDAQPDTALLLDPAGTILAANDALARRLGYARGRDLEGREIYSLLAPQVAASRREQASRVIETGLPVSFRDERDGRILENSLRPVRDASGGVAAVAVHSRDVTDQVLQQREIADHERRLRLLLDSLPALVAHVGRDGRYRQVNGKHAEFFGSPREDFAGRTLREMLGEPLYARLEPYIGRVLAGEPQAFTIDHAFADGVDRWLDVRYVPDREGDAVVGFYALVLDITETYHAREQLRASESQLELFFDHVPVAICMGGADGVIARANPAAEEFFGYGPGELSGISLEALTHPDDLRSDLAAFARMVGGETRSYSLQKRYRRRDGAVVWGDLTVMAVTEERDLFFGMIQDITEVKREEQARRDQQLESQRLLTAIEQAEESVLITDVHGAIQYVNGAFERATGYAADEVLGRKPSLLKSGRHGAAFYRELWESLTAGSSWSGRLVNRRKDGTLFTELATISPVRGDRGQLTHYVAVKRNITHELELEEQVRQSQKMEALGKLAGGIAHDFNNILYALMGNTELALAKVPAGGEVAGHLEGSLAACRRASELVAQILAFSRRHERRREVLDPARLTGETLALLQPTLPATVNLVTHIAPDSPPVAIDATEWHQLVMNLATNAVQALPEAKGRVEIRVEPGTLAEPQARRRAVRLSIRDDGCGMTADVVARCRDPYFTTKPSGVGTGMGLSIVHGIVSSLGGRLEVDSEPDVGTTIQVLVPAAVAAAAPGPDARPDATPAGDPARSCPESGTDRPATIMVVEDERAILDLAAAALGRRRYAVRTFADPQEALAAFCDDPRAVDLVITDQTMPGMTGADLTRELLAIRADLPVIVCSGHSPSFGPAEAREVGARAYLAKPVPLGELLAAVGRELAPAAAD